MVTTLGSVRSYTFLFRSLYAGGRVRRVARHFVTTGLLLRNGACDRIVRRASVSSTALDHISGTIGCKGKCGGFVG